MDERAGHLSRRAALTGAAWFSLAAAVTACTPRPTSSSPTSPAGPATSSSSPRSAPTTLGPAAPTLAALSRQLSIALLAPHSAGFASVARLYNPRFDGASPPAAIARCRTAQDVASCIRFATESGSTLAMRAGGHSYGGWSSCSGLVVDVAPMSAVSIDTAAATARVGAGATLVDLYAALAAKGVAIAGGSCPTVGITGLLLGGGVGVLSRQFGLTCDALRAATVVTADGHVRTVDPNRDPNLFWALRGGGGGSFGAVTDLTLAVRPSPVVQRFHLEWEFTHAEAVLAAWQRWVSRTQWQLWSTCKLLAEPRRDKLNVTVSGTWVGAAGALQSVLDPLLNAVGAPTTANLRASLDYASAMLIEAGCSGQTPDQCREGALGPALRRPFAATSAILSSPLPAKAILTAVAQVRLAMSLPGLVEGGVSFDALGGAVGAIPAADSAFVHRGALASIQYTATWSGASGSAAVADPAPFDRYVRGERAALLAWTGNGAYVNYADPSIADYTSAYWGANYPRLQSVKKQYDPSNLFTFSQSVKA
jgi:FAD/FMN-containing dehydrogenase